MRIDDDLRMLLLPPQRKVVDEVIGWNEAKFADDEARKEYVNGIVNAFRDEPWGGEEPIDLAMDFGKRFQQERNEGMKNHRDTSRGHDLEKESGSNLDQERVDADLDVDEEFAEEIDSFERWLEAEYAENWPTFCGNLGGSKQPIASSLQTGWEDKFRKFNTERFAEFLGDLHACSIRQLFEAEVRISDDVGNLLLPPQREEVEEVAEWDDEQFTDEDSRKAYVEGVVEQFREEPWGGQDIPEVAMQFDRRFQEENR